MKAYRFLYLKLVNPYKSIFISKWVYDIIRIGGVNMNTKYIPLDKRSKAKQKEHHSKQRKNWGEINPITRKTENKKQYNRKKSDWRRLHDPSIGFFIYKGDPNANFIFRK